MIRSKITVTMQNGQTYVAEKIGAGDLVQFERKFSVPASVFADGAETRFEWLCFLVWNRTKKTHGLAFDEFVDTLEDLEMEEQEERTLDPTGTAPISG